jgi:hypothetical protein
VGQDVHGPDGLAESVLPRVLTLGWFA